MHTDLPNHGLPAWPSGHISRVDSDGWSSAVFRYCAIVKTGFPRGYVKLYDFLLISLRQTDS